MADYFIYILSNKHHSTLYIGVTNDLQRRLYEHRTGETPGFTADYCLSELLYFESYPDPVAAIAREKQLKGWRREKKVALIEKGNPRWADLAVALFGEGEK